MSWTENWINGIQKVFKGLLLAEWSLVRSQPLVTYLKGWYWGHQFWSAVQGPHLERSSPRHKCTDQESRKKLCRKGPGYSDGHQVKHTPTIPNCGYNRKSDANRSMEVILLLCFSHSLLLWGWSDTGTGWPERLRSFHLCGYLKCKCFLRSLF